MSKYKTGDKVVLEITDKVEVMGDPWYLLSNATSIYVPYLDKAAEPLSTYIEQARAEGHSEAWKLMQKIGRMPCEAVKEIFGTYHLWDIVKYGTYPEAAAKVEAWEKAKEEEHATAERRQKVIEAAKVIKGYCNISNCFSCPIDCEESPHPFGWKIGGESDG